MGDLATQLQAGIGTSYQIDREIGRGGMATVYLARDTRHNRRVAVKVLSPELGAVLGVERFLSEIQVTANLQHPNLLPLFDSGQANGLLYYVMPYIEGESLRARLSREKQLPIDSALHIATSVASALDYAHRHGVIHRDLKPENILLHEGQPLVADFGIALAVSNAGGQRITQTGLSLGTPQYMSPEQATGDHVVDARADVYSLGAVTYEMLTGEAPHTGTTAQAIIAKVITDRPRRIALSRDTVPAHVEQAVDIALSKLPADRFASAQDFANALAGKGVAIPSTISTPGSLALYTRATGRKRWMMPAIAAALIVAAATSTWYAARARAKAEVATIQFSIPMGTATLGQGVGTPLALSKDGRTIAYVAAKPGKNFMLYARTIGDVTVHEIPGTDGADQPAFSPDGKWVVFAAYGQLKKTPVDGTGAPLVLAPSGSCRGIAWSTKGEMIYGTNSGPLQSIPESGGTPKVIAAVELDSGATDRRWPVLFDHDRSLLYTLFKASLPLNEIWAMPASGGPGVRVTTGAMAVGVIEGRLAYVNGAGTLMSAPFDVKRMRITGPSIAHVTDVGITFASSAAFAAMSGNGNLIYLVGGQKTRLMLSDLRGTARPLLDSENSYSFPRFSPDGRSVAVSIQSGFGWDVWVYDRAANTSSKLTTTGASERPEWTPDGKRVVFRSTQWIAWQPADRSGSAETLLKLDRVNLQEAVISPRGDYLMARAQGNGWTQDPIYVRMGDTTVHAFFKSQFAEYGYRFSPDERWVAYSSDESGQQQVYVTPFPGPGPHYQVSTDGGLSPVWSPDGRRLFFTRSQTMMMVTLKLSPGFAIERRDSLFTGPYYFPFNHANYDIAPNGKELLLLRRKEIESSPVFVYNWARELRAATH